MFGGRGKKGSGSGSQKKDSERTEQLYSNLEELSFTKGSSTGQTEPKSAKPLLPAKPLLRQGAVREGSRGQRFQQDPTNNPPPPLPPLVEEEAGILSDIFRYANESEQLATKIEGDLERKIKGDLERKGLLSKEARAMVGNLMDHLRVDLAKLDNKTQADFKANPLSAAVTSGPGGSFLNNSAMLKSSTTPSYKSEYDTPRDMFGSRFHNNITSNAAPVKPNPKPAQLNPVPTPVQDESIYDDVFEVKKGPSVDQVYDAFAANGSEKSSRLTTLKDLILKLQENLTKLAKFPNDKLAEMKGSKYTEMVNSKLKPILTAIKEASRGVKERVGLYFQYYTSPTFRIEIEKVLKEAAQGKIDKYNDQIGKLSRELEGLTDAPSSSSRKKQLSAVGKSGNSARITEITNAIDSLKTDIAKNERRIENSNKIIEQAEGKFKGANKDGKLTRSQLDPGLQDSNREHKPVQSRVKQTNLQQAALIKGSDAHHPHPHQSVLSRSASLDDAKFPDGQLEQSRSSSLVADLKKLQEEKGLTNRSSYAETVKQKRNNSTDKGR